MELFFIFSALRRYFWVVLLCIAGGVLVALAVTDTDGDGGFESHGVLLVSPPDEAAPGVFTGDSDRYVSGQITVMGSEGLANRVAERLNDGTGSDEVRAALEIDIDPRSNVVTLRVTSDDGAWARRVVGFYLEEYLDLLEESVARAQADEIDELDAEIDAARASLAEVDRQIQEVSAPYIGSDSSPGLDQLAPALASEKNRLADRVRSLESSRIAELSELKVSTIVAEPATVPTPLPAPTAVAGLATGLVGGGFVGFLLALILASTSRTLLGDDQAEEILGQSVLGSFPVLRGVAHDRIALFDELEPSASEIVSTIAIRADAASSGEGPLTVVVTGTGPQVGTTTVAASIARGFARSGAQVRIVDADQHHPELTERFGASNDHPGRDDAPDGVEVRSLDAALDRAAGTVGDRRPDVRTLMERADERIDVIVIDGGALMETPTTARFAAGSDAVVLVMPKQQQTRVLESVVRQLATVDTLLAVWAPVGTRRGAVRVTH